MKNNKEFLEGAYTKARVLQQQKNRISITNRKYLNLSSIAAIIILVPTLFLLNSNLGYKEIPQTPMSMIRAFNEPISIYQEADYIVVGQTKEIGESIYVKNQNYIYTNILFSIDEVLSGKIDESQIHLKIDGGKVRKDKVFSKLEGKFAKGQRSLLFLIKDDGGEYLLIRGSEVQLIEVEKDIFKDKAGNKYSLEEIKNNIMLGDK